MPIPIAQIISAAAPLVMSAVDLYRRRNEAKAAGGEPSGGDSLQRRLQALEEADVEQTRLIAELSRSLEALARNYESVQAENRRKEARIRQLLWTIVALSLTSTVLAVWAIARG